MLVILFSMYILGRFIQPIFLPLDLEFPRGLYKVRYIGMDTPEKGDPYYNKATQANATLVANKTIRLEKDVSETDKYGRLLRYVMSVIYL